MANSAEGKNFRVALIGYGIGGAVFHAPLVHAVPGLHLAAIVTSNVARVEQARAAYPQAKILATADEIFASPGDYDLVVVASPNRYHFPQAKAALECGLDVVIDKPMATNSSDCRALIELAKKQKRLLSVFQNRRLDGDFLTVQEMIRENLLGKIVRFESRFERYRPEPRAGAWRELGTLDDGGGLLFDLGSHLIDQACYLFGDPVDVYCELDKRRPGVETDDDCFVALSFAGGVRAHLWASVLCRIKGPRFRVLGHNGSFEKYGMDPQEDALRAGRRPTEVAWGADSEEHWGDLLTTVNGLTVQGKVETLAGCYQNYYAGILAAMRQNGPVPVDPSDALRTTLIVEAAFKSASEKSVEKM